MPHQVLNYADAAVDSLFSPVSGRIPLVGRVKAVVASVWAPAVCVLDVECCPLFAAWRCSLKPACGATATILTLAAYHVDRLTLRRL